AADDVEVGQAVAVLVDEDAGAAAGHVGGEDGDHRRPHLLDHRHPLRLGGLHRRVGLLGQHDRRQRRRGQSENGRRQPGGSGLSHGWVSRHLVTRASASVSCLPSSSISPSAGATVIRNSRTPFTSSITGLTLSARLNSAANSSLPSPSTVSLTLLGVTTEASMPRTALNSLYSAFRSYTRSVREC